MALDLFCVEWSAVADVEALHAGGDEAQELFADGLGIVFKGRVDGVVEAEDAANEDAGGEEISYEGLVVLENYGEGAFGVAGRVVYGAGYAEAGEVEGLFAGEQDVGLEGGVGLVWERGLEEEAACQPGGTEGHWAFPLVVGEIVLMGDEGGFGFFAKLGGAPGVIDMGVGDDDGLDVFEGESVAGESLFYFGGGAGKAGVDEDASCGAEDEVGVGYFEGEDGDADDLGHGLGLHCDTDEDWSRVVGKGVMKD